MYSDPVILKEARMIYGLGTDIVEIGRIAGTLARFGDRFVQRILAPSERPRFARVRDPANHLAKRFAAKEAFAKAIGTGIRSPFRWHAVAIGRDARGKPLLVPDAAMAEWLAAQGVNASHVSLSDDGGMATATVVLEA
jgi:holo-[acyl-carrier protein] synthase